jgi:protein gp37
MKTHKIGWLNIPGYIPETWNPIVGCSKISPGCEHCYAERMARRLAAMDVAGYNDGVLTSTGNWGGKTVLVESALEKPMHWNKPRAIFINSMGDLFHENTPYEWIDRVFAIAALCPQHLFLVLSKRAERMAKYIIGGAFNDDTVARVSIAASKIKVPVSVRWPLPNVWLGVSAENQEQYDNRIRNLLSCPAAIRFVSGEPLLGAIHADYIGMLDWVICGGESGPGARPMNPDWARSLRDQCMDSAVPFFFKQHGSALWGTPYHQEPNKGGDVLDGRRWHEFPGGES